MPALNILVGTARCHIQYNDPPQVQTNTITHNKTNPGSFVKCKLRDPTGNLTFVYMTNKRRHVFLNSAKNSPFLSVLLPSSVCVAAFSADKTSQEVEQMLPWHPSGPRTPALPPTADAPRGIPRIPGPAQQGAAPTKRKLPCSGSFEQWRSTETALMLLSFVLRVTERDTSQLSGRTFGFIRGVSSLFQHSLAHTPFWKTNTNDGNASIWRRLVRKCSLDRIIISKYVRRRFHQVTKLSWFVLLHMFSFISRWNCIRVDFWFSFPGNEPKNKPSFPVMLHFYTGKLLVLFFLKVWEPSRLVDVHPTCQFYFNWVD